MEQYVSFEVAKLLSEKGYSYRNSIENKAYHLDEPDRMIDSIMGNIVRGYILAPPMSEVVDLLRNKYNVYVAVGLSPYHGDKPGYYPIIKSLSSKDMGYTLLQGFTIKLDYYEALDDGLKAILVDLPIVELDKGKERHQQVDIQGQLDPLYAEFADKAERFGNECKITVKGKVLIAADPRRLFEKYKAALNEDN